MVLKFEQHHSKVIQAHTKRKMISTPPPTQAQMRKKGRDKKTGTTMAGRFECLLCDKSKARIQIAVRSVSRGCWRSLMRSGRGELFHQRVQRFFFSPLNISPKPRSAWSINRKGEYYTTSSCSNRTLIHILQ